MKNQQIIRMGARRLREVRRADARRHRAVRTPARWVDAEERTEAISV